MLGYIEIVHMCIFFKFYILFQGKEWPALIKLMLVTTHSVRLRGFGFPQI